MANFNYFLNRQGSSGRQGVKGDKGEAGYSPYIDIKSNTPTEFIMTIHNETESFDTPNLIPTAIGEKVTEMDAVLTTHTEDIANLKLDITAIKNKNNAQDSDIAALKTRVGGTEESIEDLNHKYTVLGSEVSDLTLTKQNKLVEGANITLTDNADGTTTISASGGGGGGGTGDVTAAGDNRFTGDNTFTGKVNIAGGALTVDGLATLNQTTAQYLNAVSITSTGEVNAVSIKANGLRSDDIQTTENKKYLTELDVDNQTIQVVNGKLHANLDELGNEVNNLSSRVTTNEADISAMKTGKQNKLKAGTNITLTDNPDGTTTVASTGGGSGTGDVTAAGDNTFTGSNTFTSTTTFNASIAVSGGGSTIGTSLNEDTGTYIDLKVNSQADLILGTGTVVTQDADGGTHIRDGQIKDTTGNILLSQGNITAGNNITITKTSKGVQIASSGGGSSEPPANMVTTDTNQDITGIKTFKGDASNNDPSIIFGGKRIGMDDVIGGKIKVNGNNNFEISTGAKGANSAIFRLSKSTDNDPCYFDFTSNTTTMIPTIRLGNQSYQGTIEYDTSVYPFGFSFKTHGALSGYSYSSFKIADNTLTFKKTDGTVVDLLNNSSKEQYGIRADYALTHGIVDNPNGIISYNATDKVITVHQGLVLKTAGTNASKTTIASDITHTVTSTGDFTLFYANGELLECGKVDYSTEEPTNNGVTNYQAWFNPDKTVNTNQQWQFKSNDSGNVWRYVDNSTPLADIVADSTAITSVSYLGYRVTDDDIFAHKNDWVTKNGVLLQDFNRPSTNTEIDLSSLLPVDNENYEILISVMAVPNPDVKNKFTAVVISSKGISPSIRVVQARTQIAGVDNSQIGACVIPVDTTRKISLGGSSSSNNDGKITIWLNSYRKIS